MGSKAITIWEVEFTSVHTLARVESLSLSANFPSKEKFYFYLAVSWVISSNGIKWYIWDTKHSKYLLHATWPELYMTSSFSSDGCSLACSTTNSGVDIWKESPTGYMLHQTLPSSSGNEICISSNGELLLTWSSSVAQLWHIRDSSIPNLNLSWRYRSNHLVVFSPDDTLTAVAVKNGDTTVTIFDLKSGVPRLIIDAGMSVHALGVTGGTIVVVVDIVIGQKVVTWSIPARGCVLNPKATIDDSVKTMTFNDQSMVIRTLSASVSPDLQCVVFMEDN